jgi:hypothetical protein
MINGVVALPQTLFDLWCLMMKVEGKTEGPLCYDELGLRRMLRFLEFELKITLGKLSRIWKAYRFREVHGAPRVDLELDSEISLKD